MTMIDFPSLWAQVTANALRHPYTLHGPDHWERVERNGRVLANRTGADVVVVRLFALFHDSRRENDGYDPGHGRRGARYAEEFRQTTLACLSETQFEQLRFACTWHTDHLHHEDPTIGTCWDADRLDLGRVGIIPEAQFMSTEFAREVADFGSFYAWRHLFPSDTERC